jgi:hypothetical protein
VKEHDVAHGVSEHWTCSRPMLSRLIS